MESIQTHPSTAAQAKAFTAPGSFAFPSGHHDVSGQPVQPVQPVDVKANGQAPVPNGNGNPPANGVGVTPATPAATPAAAPGASGLTPTLQ